MSDEIKHMLKAILEGQHILTAKIDRLETGQQETNKRLDKLETGQQETNERLDKVENRLARFESGITNVGESLNYVIKDVYLLQKRQG